MRWIIAVGVILVGILLIATQAGEQSVASGGATITPTYAPGREPIQLSTTYQDELVHYATVERSDGVIRFLYISPQAIEAVREGELLPERTLVVIEAYRPLDNNPAERQRDPEVHVAESRSTWQIADLAASSRVGTWNFGAFDADTGAVITATGLNDCFSCHEAAQTRNFIFSNTLLEAYAQTDQVQYSYCPRPGRTVCR